MIYTYNCCGRDFEVIKPLSEYNSKELCDVCDNEATRVISRVSLVAIHDWTESYNPAFGCVVKNKAHQREILCKLKGQGKEFVEVGDEPVEKIHQHFDSQRAAKRKERWSESTEQVLKEGLQ